MRYVITQKNWLGSILTLLLVIAGSRPAFTQSALNAEDFTGKQIRLVVGSAPGGAYDSYARTVAAHMPKHLPGNPKIVVQNMPGAGSLVALNYIYNIAPKDGTVIAAVHSVAGTHPLYFPSRAKYDARKLNWLGSLLRERIVGVVWHTSPVQDFRDMLGTKELIVASSSGSTTSFPSFTKSVLGAKLNIIKGYAASSAVMLAMERGEVNGVIGMTYTALKIHGDRWSQEKKMKVFLQFGLSKHADLGDTPWIYDFARSDDERAAMDLMFGTQEFGRPYLAPPDIPDRAKRTLRAAFERTANDAEFRAEAKMRNLEVDFTPPEEISSILDKMYTASPETVARVKEVLGDDAPQ